VYGTRLQVELRLKQGRTVDGVGGGSSRGQCSLHC
jgi:hypothetical protein